MKRLKWIASAAGVVVVASGVTGVALAEASPATSPAAASTRNAAAPGSGNLAASGDTSTGSASASTVAATATAAATAARASAHASNGSSDTQRPASSSAAAASGSGNGAVAANSSISLSSWAGLLLPINDQGQLSGKDAKVISPAALYSPWLTQTSGGALQFWAPSGAATTPGSLHSRTELESAIKYDVGTQRHELGATLEIEQLPKSNPEICVAQLHAGGTGGSDPFVMFDFKSGKLYVMVASGTSAAANFYTLLTNVPVDTSFSYHLTDNGNGTLTLAASYGSQSKSYTVDVPSALKGASGHFSAGDYEQGTVSEGSNDGGKVLFTSLTQS
jgi:Alginate lyase